MGLRLTDFNVATNCDSGVIKGRKHVRNKFETTVMPISINHRKKFRSNSILTIVTHFPWLVDLRCHCEFDSRRSEVKATVEVALA